MLIQGIGQQQGITAQKVVIFTDTHSICKLEILQLLCSLSIALP